MRFSRPSDDERGAALLEFALVIPLVLLILFGIFEFGLAMHRLQGMHAAAHDAARVGALPAVTADQVEARALASLGDGFPGETPTITIQPASETPCAEAEEIIVTIEAANALILPLWDRFDVTLTSTAEFSCS